MDDFTWSAARSRATQDGTSISALATEALHQFLGMDSAGDDERLAKVERRLARIERMADGGGSW